MFAERGFDATTVEEVAARAEVSKPVVYEHFGGKEGLYAVVVDREVRALLDRHHHRADRRPPARAARAGGAGAAGLHRGGDRRLPGPGPRVARAARRRGDFSTMLNDVATRSSTSWRRSSRPAASTTKLAELYSQALVGHGRADRPVVAGGRASRARRSPPTWSTSPGTACPTSIPGRVCSWLAEGRAGAED